MNRISLVAWVGCLFFMSAAAAPAEEKPPAAPDRSAIQNPQSAISPKVGAYYYPWYYTERWTKEPTDHTPALGFYRSDDAGVAAQHVKWAREAGLDFFAVSFIRPGSEEDKNFKAAVLPAIEKSDLKFALLYDTALSLGLPAGKPLDLDFVLPDGTTAGQLMSDHFDYLAANYLKHGSYLNVGGKPVVLVYLVRDLANAGPTLTKVRRRMVERGIDLFLVADAVYWAEAPTLDWALLHDQFQSVMAYNMYHRPQFLEQVKRQYKAADGEARKHGLALVPNVMPGYDDTPLRGEERVTLNRRRGQFYRDFWAVAAPYVMADQPLMLITSFNEWHEGTEIEPSTEFGDQYLKLTRELIGSLRSGR
jgi:hypothetical protein